MAYRLVAQEQCVCCCDLDKTDGSAGIHAECIAFGVVAAPIGGGKSTTMADIRREIESSREDVSKVIKEEAFKDTIKRLKIDHDGSTPFDVVVDDNDVAYMTLPENVEQWEFLLSCMYKRKNLFEFQLEVQAHLADMVRMSVAAIETVGPITAPLHSRCIYLRKIILIPERSSEDVRLVFLPFDKGAFSKVQYKSMQGMLRCMKELPIFRDASVIYLHVSPQTCFERKTRRDRPSEKGVSLEFLERMGHYYEAYETAHGKSLHRVNNWEGTRTVESITKEVITLLNAIPTVPQDRLNM